MILPVLLVFISAFADEMYINQHGFSFFPQVWSMNGMDSVLRYGNQLVQSYLVTIFVTVAGTLLGLLIIACTLIPSAATASCCPSSCLFSC